jgi:hypothetical protein
MRSGIRKRKSSDTAWPQLPEGGPHLGLVDVDEGVEGDETRQRPVGQLERPHVADAELDRGRELAGAVDHPGREIDAEHPDPLLVEMAGHVARPAAQIRDEPATTHVLRETVQQVPVERLAGQLAEDALGVGRRELVVALTETGDVLAHGTVASSRT